MVHTESERIIALTYDFGGGTVRDPDAFKWKLARDGYRAEDSLLVIAWGNERRTVRFSDTVTVELFRAFAGRSRVFYDLCFIVVAPYLAWRTQFRPDRIVIADFPLAWAALALKIVRGGRIELRLSGLPRALGKTRGRFQQWYHVVHETLGKRIPDSFIAINDATKRYLLDIGITPKRVTVRTPDVITADAAYIAQAHRGEARRALGISEKEPFILSVGRLEAEKGQEELIQTFLDSGCRGVLVLIGSGSQQPALETLVQKRQAQKRVLFAGLKPRATIWNYYKDADAFALLSHSESLGLALWEAMYAGVPVIGRPIGGIKETIGRDGERGFFWDSVDGSAAFKAKLERCFKKDAEVRAMVGRARSYVETKIAHE